MESPRPMLTAEESSDKVPDGRAFMEDSEGAPGCFVCAVLLRMQAPAPPRTLLTARLNPSLTLKERLLRVLNAFRT